MISIHFAQFVYVNDLIQTDAADKVSDKDASSECSNVHKASEDRDTKELRREELQERLNDPIDRTPKQVPTEKYERL